MEQQYLIDTNVVIDYLDNKLPEGSISFIDKSVIKMSVINRMELLAWPNATNEQLVVLNQLINDSIVFNLDESVIIKAIELRRTYRIKLPDAIIAATALVYNLTLLTRNINDFRNITGISVASSYSV